MNTQYIKKIIEMFDSSDSIKLKIVDDNFEISLEKSDDKNKIDNIASVSQVISTPNVTPLGTQQPIHVNLSSTPSNIDSSQSRNIDNKDTIKSPMVGTFYRAPSPDSAPYVKVGDEVKKGQIVAVIEAMKIMNEIEAEFDCRIVEILPSNAQSVEFNAVLFVVDKI